jgi:pimeloyl-ACP methyl ester carboxylesterase
MTERASGGRMELEPAMTFRPSTTRGLARRPVNFRSGALVPMLLAPLLAFACLPVTAQTPPAAPVLQWSACPDVPKTECAVLDVPVDPARPDGAKLALRLGRVPAAYPAQNKGMLLILPGGPGAGIVEMFRDTRSDQHIEELAQQYDVVTFDPRGIGKSSPILCAPNAVPPVVTPVATPPSPAGFQAIADANAALYRSCFAATGELMAHLSAIDTANDIERIRQALTPNDGLVAYGGSYGSQYGATYLELYGDHVKALVLDAVVDHSVDFATLLTHNVLSVKDGFDRFTQWCARDSTCALHGQDLGAVFDAAVTAAPAARMVVTQLLAAGAHPEFGWPALAKMLAEVRRGDTSTLDAMSRTTALGSTAADPRIVAGKNGLFAGVFCSDFAPQGDLAALSAAAAAVAAQAPRFAWKFWDATPLAHGTASATLCAGWPNAATNPPHRLKVGPHPNVMVASPANDPATPLVNALSLWLQIPQARLLIADVDGHQSFLLSACAFKAELRFLNDPTSVPITTLCPD